MEIDTCSPACTLKLNMPTSHIHNIYYCLVGATISHYASVVLYLVVADTKVVAGVY